MPDPVKAHTLLLETAARARLGNSILERIFEGVPLDFFIRFSPTLPFFVHRLGMSGITLFGRVHLLGPADRYEPIELIVLLRHEAEHVRQQRKRGSLFYPQYLWHWTREFLRGNGPLTGRWHRAYMNIPDEREAYMAGRRARIILNRK